LPIKLRSQPNDFNSLNKNRPKANKNIRIKISNIRETAKRRLIVEAFKFIMIL
jgi:hypothetical protein